MTRKHIIEKIQKRTGYDKADVTVIVDEFLSTIKNNMGEGHNIYLRGFGSFILKHHRDKNVYNINDGSHYLVPAHYVPAFRAGKDILSRI
jgi:DNA-binding protein HU-beta